MYIFHVYISRTNSENFELSHLILLSLRHMNTVIASLFFPWHITQDVGIQFVKLILWSKFNLLLKFLFFGNRRCNQKGSRQNNAAVGPISNWDTHSYSSTREQRRVLYHWIWRVQVSQSPSTILVYLEKPVILVSNSEKFLKILYLDFEKLHWTVS